MEVILENEVCRKMRDSGVCRMDTRCRYAHSEHERGLIFAAERAGNVPTMSRIRNPGVIAAQNAPPVAMPKARPFFETT